MVVVEWFKEDQYKYIQLQCVSFSI